VPTYTFKETDTGDVFDTELSRDEWFDLPEIGKGEYLVDGKVCKPYVPDDGGPKRINGFVPVGDQPRYSRALGQVIKNRAHERELCKEHGFIPARDVPLREPETPKERRLKAIADQRLR
jgi:hypothetical protein